MVLEIRAGLMLVTAVSSVLSLGVAIQRDLRVLMLLI